MVVFIGKAENQQQWKDRNSSKHCKVESSREYKRARVKEIELKEQKQAIGIPPLHLLYHNTVDEKMLSRFRYIRKDNAVIARITICW